MARRRTDLYRSDKPRKRGGGRKWRHLPIATFVKAFVAISVVMAALGTLLWFLGIMDFTAERGYLRFMPGVGESRRSKLTFCGAVFVFLPAHLESVRLCIVLNILPFTVLPLIVLVMMIRRLIAGVVDERD